MKGKKAFELSATFLVILILTIVIFTGSIYFTKKFFASAQQMKGQIDQETEKEIESLLYNQNALVGLPMNTKEVQVGKSVTFGLGIRNTFEAQKGFYVRIDFARAYDRNEEVLSKPDSNYIEDKWVIYDEGPHPIRPNEFVSIPILMNVDTSMATGVVTERGASYTFNVCVFDDPAKRSDCDLSAAGRGTLLSNVYGGKVLQITLRT